jgi:hypothetical protein
MLELLDIILLPGTTFALIFTNAGWPRKLLTVLTSRIRGQFETSNLLAIASVHREGLSNDLSQPKHRFNTPHIVYSLDPADANFKCI